MSKEILHSSVQEKEAKVLGKSKENVKGQEGIINEDTVVEAITAMEQKLQHSPLSTKYKGIIGQKLDETISRWTKDVDAFKAGQGGKYEKLFEELFDKTLKDFQEFEQKPGIKEIFECILPLYEKSEKVKRVINLPEYSHKTPFWQVINDYFMKLGFDKTKLAGAQRILGISADGQIGPETIKTINRVIFEKPHDIRWNEKENIYKPLEPKDFGVKTEDEILEISQSKKWEQIDRQTLERLTETWKSYENAKTFSDLMRLENDRKEAVENEKKEKDGYIAELKALGAEESGRAKMDDPDLAEFKDEMSFINIRLAVLNIGIFQALFVKAYKDTPKEKRIAPKVVGAHIDRLVNVVEALPVFPKAIVMTNTDRIKQALMLLAQGNEKSAMMIIDNIIAEFEATEVETSEIPAAFTALNERHLHLPIDALTLYYKAYMQIPATQRIPIAEIGRILGNLRDRYLKGESTRYEKQRTAAETGKMLWDYLSGEDVKQDEQKGPEMLVTPVDQDNAQQALILAFGKLINGQRKNLLDSGPLLENITKARKKYAELQKVLEDRQKSLSYSEESRQKKLDYLGRLVRDNPGPLNFWTDSNKPQIVSIIHEINKLERRILEYKSEIFQIQGQQKILLKFTFFNQYQLLKNAGESTRDLLLSMSDALGDDFPEEFKPEVAKAEKEFLDDPKVSELQKLILAGKYDEALDFMVKRNIERTDVIGGLVGEHDIVRIYRQYKNSPATKALIGRLLKRPGFGSSFACEKIMRYGYIPVCLEEGDDEIIGDAAWIYLIKENPDGSLNYVQIDLYGKQALMNVSERNYVVERPKPERTIEIQKIDEIDQDDTRMKEAFGKIISEKPSFKALAKAGAEIGAIFAPLQMLFQKTLEGTKPDEFVSRVKAYAEKMKTSADIATLRANLSQAKADLAKMKLLTLGEKDEFEKDIFELEKQLKQVTVLVEGNKIEDLCDHILSGDFSSDDFWNWVIRDAIPFLGAILTAVAAMALICTGVGAGLGGLMLMSAVGTIGGIAGHELFTLGSHYLGKAAYGDKFSNKTMLGKYLTKEKVYNPRTGAMVEITGRDLENIYGEQFVNGFLTTFTLLGCGHLVGGFLSKFAARYGASEGFKGMTAKLLNKIPRLGRREIDLLRQKGLDGMLKRIGREFLEETPEEIKEHLGEKVHPALGFLVSLYHCLNGRAVSYKMGKYKVVAGETSVEGDETVVTNWSYDASKRAEFEEAMRREYGKQGLSVQTAEDGTVTVETSCKSKKGVLKVKMVFKPTTESLSVRQLMTEGIDESRRSEVERLYGVKRVGENAFEFDNLKPEGKITLIQYLQRNGFVITVDAAMGGFVAVKGNENVSFRPKQEVEEEEDTAEGDATGQRERQDEGDGGSVEREATTTSNGKREQENKPPTSSRQPEIKDYSNPEVRKTVLEALEVRHAAGEISQGEFDRQKAEITRRAHVDLMGHLIEEGEKWIENNPDATVDEIFNHMVEFGKQKGLEPSKTQKKMIRTVAEKYVESRKVAKPIEDALNDPDPVKAREAKIKFLADLGLTDINPDNVRIVVEGDSFVLMLKKHDDYMKCWRLGTKDMSESEVSRGYNSAGFFTSNKPYQNPKLIGKVFYVSLEVTKDIPKTAIHERQHGRFRAYLDSQLYAYAGNREARIKKILDNNESIEDKIEALQKQGLIKFRPNTTPEQKARQVYAMQQLLYYTNYMKNETLAYLKMGRFEFDEIPLFAVEISDADFKGDESMRVHFKKCYDLLVTEVERLRNEGYSPQSLCQIIQTSDSFTEIIARLREIGSPDTDEASLKTITEQLTEEELEIFELYEGNETVDLHTDIPISFRQKIALAKKILKDRQYKDEYSYQKQLAEKCSLEIDFDALEHTTYDTSGGMMTWETRAETLEKLLILNKGLKQLGEYSLQIAAKLQINLTKNGFNNLLRLIEIHQEIQDVLAQMRSYDFHRAETLAHSDEYLNFFDDHGKMINFLNKISRDNSYSKGLENLRKLNPKLADQISKASVDENGEPITTERKTAIISRLLDMYENLDDLKKYDPAASQEYEKKALENVWNKEFLKIITYQIKTEVFINKIKYVIAEIEKHDKNLAASLRQQHGIDDLLKTYRQRLATLTTLELEDNFTFWDQVRIISRDLRSHADKVTPKPEATAHHQNVTSVITPATTQPAKTPPVTQQATAPDITVAAVAASIVTQTVVADTVMAGRRNAAPSATHLQQAAKETGKEHDVRNEASDIKSRIRRLRFLFGELSWLKDVSDWGNKENYLKEFIERLQRVQDMIENEKKDLAASIDSILSKLKEYDRIRTEAYRRGQSVPPLHKYFSSADIHKLAREIKKVFEADAELLNIESKTMEIPPHLHVSALVGNLDVVFTHALVESEAGRTTHHTVVNSGTTWDVMARIVSTLEPEIATSTVGETSGDTIYSRDLGLIIGDGVITAADKEDIGSTIGEGNRRVASNKDALNLTQGHVLTSILNVRGWNEVIIRHPKVCGIFINLNWVKNFNSNNNFAKKEARTGIAQAIRLSNDLDIPVYVKDGKKFFKITFSDDGVPIAATTETRPGEMLKDTKVLTTEEKESKLKELIDDAPFRLKLRDKYGYDRWKLTFDFYAIVKKELQTGRYREWRCIKDISFGTWGQEMKNMNDYVEQIRLAAEGYKARNEEDQLFASALILYAISEAALADGDADVASKTENFAKTFLSRDEYNKFLAKRVNHATRGFKMTHDELDKIYSDTDYTNAFGGKD